MNTADRAPELVLLANDAMRARRRPRAVVTVWAIELAFALPAAWAAAAVVAGFYGSHPRGDAPLWNAGALSLIDFGVHARAAAPALLVQLGLLVVLGAALGLLPAAGLIASIAYTTREVRPPPLRLMAPRAAVAFLPMLLVLGCAASAQAVLAFLAWHVGAWVDDLSYSHYGEVRADQLGCVAAALILLGAALVGIAQDVARAAIVRFRVGGLVAMKLAAGALRRAPFSLFWSWGWRALASLVPLAFGYLVAERIGGVGGAPLFALAFVHQVVALSRVGLRASWLARSLRAIDAAYCVVTGSQEAAVAVGAGLPDDTWPQRAVMRR